MFHLQKMHLVGHHVLEASDLELHKRREYLNTNIIQHYHQTNNSITKQMILNDLLNSMILSFKETTLQTLILTVKNTILYWRRWKSTLVQLVAPFAVVLILFILMQIVSTIKPDQYVNPKDVPYQRKLSRCFKKFTRQCYTIRYSTNGNEFAGKVIQRVLNTQTHIPYKEIVEHTSESEMLFEMNKLKNSTLYAINFAGDEPYHQTMLETASPDTATIGTRYVIYVNASDTGITHETLALQTLIDNAIAGLRLNLSAGYDVFDPVMNNWPLPPTDTDGQAQVLSVVGPQFFSICAMLILVISMYSLVVEKEHRLRFGMKMMGLRDSSYYLSWFISFTVICFITSLITVFSGMIFQIKMFLNTNWFILFALFFTFELCLICAAFLLSTIVNTGKASLILGFIIMAITFVLNMFVANSASLYNLYGDQISPAAVGFLSLYPPFNFARIFSDIYSMSMPIYDKFERTYVPGPGYKWKDLYRDIEYTSITGTITPPPTHLNFYYMLAMGIALLIIAWYLDNVLPGATGIPRKPWFFLQPSFYGIKFRRTSTSDLSKWKQEELEQLPKDHPLRREYEDVRNPDIPYALRLVGLQKTFDRFFGLLKSHTALKGLNLGVLPATCVAFLGHNGAGKSTTMNILTGLLNSSGGDAFIFGKDVKTDIDQIRKRIGICPQHDILWDDLTAKEHLLLFGLFKDVPIRNLDAMANYLLKKVNLYKVANNNAGSFSGGMKRRLSVAIACIGDPEVILLDEPTTGMDPHSRRQVWDLIEEMKGKKGKDYGNSQFSRERVIVLTTHAMDEADALSDRISIVAHGELQAIGDSLSLKKQYGAGYTLTLMAHAGRAQDVEKLATENLPTGAETVSKNAGSFIYQIPTAVTEDLGTFLEVLEQESEKENSCLKDWGIAHTSLEQVYLIVTEKVEQQQKQKPQQNEELPLSDVELTEVASSNDSQTQTIK
jgi:ABC-type multidrug transport system ATPase subunit